jgi:hypothetical protein
VNLKAIPLLSAQRIPEEQSRLLVNNAGLLRIGRLDRQIEFAFRLLGLRFTANTRPAESGTVLQLAAEVGPVPYSAEGVGIRRAALTIIETSQVLPEARLVISRSRWIYVIGKASLPNAWTAADAISASARLVLQVKPYLAMLLEVLPPQRRQH